MKRLIINADDFGLHTQVNQAILQGHAEGCIASSSLMAVGSAFEEAASAALKTPSLGIGVHLTLVAERPALAPERVPTLVDARGNFPDDYGVFIRRYFLGKVSRRELYAELNAQIERVIAAGVSLTHIDSHQHLHVLPGIAPLCIDLAKQHGIRAMRIPAESYFFTGEYPAGAGRLIGRTGLTFLAERARRRAMRAGLAVPEHFFGMLAGGHLSTPYLEKIIDALPEGTSEIMMHPGCGAALLAKRYGWEYGWEDELAAVLNPGILQKIRQRGIKICSFGELIYE